MMKIDRRLLLVITALAFSALACQAVMSGLQKDAGQSNPQSYSSSPIILFEDDFSDSSSGWDNFEDEDGITGYREEGYQILIKKSDWYFWSTPGLNLADVIIDVDTFMHGGPENNEFGVICRYLNNENFYIFSISSDGFYGISKFVNGVQSGVGLDEMQFDDSTINLGAASNHIRASCIGENLTLEVNGRLLAGFKDSDLTLGDVGLIASTFNEAGTDIIFDNFVVTQP